MRKVLIATAALLVMTTAATAQHYQRRYNPPPKPHRHNIAPWVAGGLALGVLGALTYDQWGRPVRCWDELVGYDRYGREVWERYCR